LQLRRLHEQNQPLEQLDEVIKEIMELMLKSADTASRGEAEQKRKQQQQQCRSSSSSRKMEQMESSKDLFGIQEDFQQLRGEAHEQELMIFAAEEYDAGASLHISQPASQPRQRACIQRLKRGATSFKFELNVIKCLGW
jgi:hypothetical protein